MTDAAIRDEDGNELHRCSECGYLICPLCGSHMMTVGRRTGVRVGHPRGTEAPLVRCRSCSYLRVADYDVWGLKRRSA